MPNKIEEKTNRFVRHNDTERISVNTTKEKCRPIYISTLNQTKFIEHFILSLYVYTYILFNKKYVDAPLHMGVVHNK